MTVVEFILARIEEDEDAAQAAIETDHVHEDNGRMMCPSERCAHDMRHDPVRVLRDCVAKRQIVEFYAGVLELWPTGDYLMSQTMLHTMATVWADHPDWDYRWTL